LRFFLFVYGRRLAWRLHVGKDRANYLKTAAFILWRRPCGFFFLCMAAAPLDGRGLL
jgi:hypothetical protein